MTAGMHAPNNARQQGQLSWWAEMSSGQRQLGKGEFLFHRGDRVRAMYRLEHGRVQLERRAFDGRLLILHVARPGELLAEASLFGDAYHCDAAASEQSVVSSCARETMLGALTADSAKALEFGRQVARQLRSVRLSLEVRNIRSARDRVLVYLELKTDPTNRAMPVDGTLQDIASEIGLSREALYRTLSLLERQGAIRRDGATISLLHSA